MEDVILEERKKSFKACNVFWHNIAKSISLLHGRVDYSLLLRKSKGHAIIEQRRQKYQSEIEDSKENLPFGEILGKYDSRFLNKEIGDVIFSQRILGSKDGNSKTSIRSTYK